MARNAFRPISTPQMDFEEATRMATAPEIISEYEAAALVAMSPDLLRWMTSYAPKTGVKTKLKIARKEDDRIFYNRDEILSFDAFLRQPWPAKTGKRPNIPTKIRDEIRVEANGECAMCCQHGNKCEAAHLVPVATTQSNHPENLLWLCANHHTSYDKGHYGPKLGDEEFVAYQKKLLRRFRVAQWQMQAELSVKLIGVSWPLLSGPSTMTVWIKEGTTNAKQEADTRADHREAA